MANKQDRFGSKFQKSL